MKKAISVNKKSRGRPKKAGGVYPVSAVRLPPDVGAAVEKWASTQPDAPSRSEAIRRLVELGLSSGSPKPPKIDQRVIEKAIDSIDRSSAEIAKVGKRAKPLGAPRR